LLNIIVLATFACSQQPTVNASTSNPSLTKSELSQPQPTSQAEVSTSAPSASQSNPETENLLSPEQKAKLLQLPIPIIAPNFLPEGFRLVRATGEAGKYINGDDDSGYTISYQGDNNTCISVGSSRSGTRGLQKVNQVQTEFGLLDVYIDKARDNSIKNIYSFLELKGNPVLISGGSIPDSNADGGFKRCNSVSLGQYIQVLKSLTLVK